MNRKYNLMKKIYLLLLITSCTKSDIHHCKWIHCPYKGESVFTPKEINARSIDSVHFKHSQLEYDELEEKLIETSPKP